MTPTELFTATCAPLQPGYLTSFEDPNAYTSGSLNGTIGIAINSQTSGIEIAGMYLDANSVLHGYIYAPSLTATTTTLTPVPTPNPSVYERASDFDRNRLLQQRHSCERRERHFHERSDVTGNGGTDKRRQPA